MAFRGRRFTFYGAFGTSARAHRAKRHHKGSFIRRTRIRGRTRYLVLKGRKRR